MKSKFALTMAVVGTSLMLAAAPAQARWHHHHGGAAAAGIAGFAAGALLGGALASHRHDYYDYDGPAYAYEPDPGAVAYCEHRFHSYNPRTGLYLGYDGRYHPCP